MRPSGAHPDNVEVGTVVLLVVALLLPTAVAAAVLWGARAGGACRERWREARRRHRATSTAGLRLDQLHADLRRLHDLLDQTENAASDLPAKNQRCRAVRAAYLDVLADACRLLEVPSPAGQPVSRSEIYRVEADLRRVGLDVRPG